MKKFALIACCVQVMSMQLYSQKKDSVSSLLQLSIESLMNIPIYSASKAPESTFEAPLSSSVVTKEQIKRTGCTSIMEALRLIPGIIVREQTNGNYDIHLRGLDNIPPNSSLIFFTGSTTLVMIDNYPVYNYLHGGTFWETLPIDINDVEKIEPLLYNRKIRLLFFSSKKSGKSSLINTIIGCNFLPTNNQSNINIIIKHSLNETELFKCECIINNENNFNEFPFENQKIENYFYFKISDKSIAKNQDVKSKIKELNNSNLDLKEKIFSKKTIFISFLSINLHLI
jgi:hypothetical protein